MFDGIDRDGNGMIDAAEIAESLQRSGDLSTSEEEISELIKQMDTQGTGFILQSTFLAATMNRSLLERKDLLESAFKKLDSDGDGLIGSEDYVKVVEDLHLLSSQGTPRQPTSSSADLFLIENKLLDFEVFVSLVFRNEVKMDAPLELRQPSCFGGSGSCQIM